ncbi:hypothetical protein QWY31_01460 [Cytophagales bacterium LB-30]|uniref:Lipoprotein n=1 Tax=Shiella aurantiaca TaxID=3058365 RepID=A0ABT8F1G7_9BACT|nr:hypothetical protein [Shiella aurantiaca]MDN4164144.1 hypothetical protein [Shiella aurantiaca]
MKKPTFNRLLGLLLGLGMLNACQFQENKLAENPDVFQEAGLKATQLGRKLENAYSIENMTKALENLKGGSNARMANEIEIVPTHRYIRLFPKSDEDM